MNGSDAEKLLVSAGATGTLSRARASGCVTHCPLAAISSGATIFTKGRMSCNHDEWRDTDDALGCCWCVAVLGKGDPSRIGDMGYLRIMIKSLVDQYNPYFWMIAQKPISAIVKIMKIDQSIG